MPTFNAGLGTSATSLSEVTPNRAAGCRGRSSRTMTRTLEIVFGDDGSNCDVTMADNGANGSSGSIKLCDFTAGSYYVVRSIVCDFSYTRVGSALGATEAIDFAIGSTAAAADNGTLSTTEVDFLAKVDGDLVAGTYAATAVTTTAVVTDARSAATAAYLNFATASNLSTADALRLSGKIWITVEAIGAT